MSRNPFGWDYPAGAENDPRAPWNQRYDDEDAERPEQDPDDAAAAQEEARDMQREQRLPYGGD